MRALLSRELTPSLAYAAAGIFLAQFVAATLFSGSVAPFAIHVLFVPVVVLLAIRVDAPGWAQMAGLAWAGIALLADITALGLVIAGGGFAPAQILSSLALVPGAAWIYGASMADEGAGHALGAAAAAGFLFSALLGLTTSLILVASWDLGVIVQQLALVAAIIWFAVLAKDLSAGKRHVGGPIRVSI